MPHTPVSILTGFLGSGKTTLLNSALRDPEMARTAVVINEFGEVGLDHALVTRSDDTIMVLENGCLCCTVFGDLITTLNRLYHAREAGEIPNFNRLIIETSGLADPAPVLQAFLSDPTLAGLYRIGSVVAVVDAVNGPTTLDTHIEAVRQVALADHILITKRDLLPADRAETVTTELAARLRRLNPAARIMWSDAPDFSAVALLQVTGFDPDSASSDVRTWLNESAYAPHAHHDHAHGSHDHDNHAHHHHGPHDNDITSFCFVREQPIAREALRLLLESLQQNLGPSLLRVKGIIHVAEEPERPAVIQGAQHLLHNLAWLDRWPDADRRSKIVFITQGFERSEIEDMIALLDRVAARTAAARARAQDPA